MGNDFSINSRVESKIHRIISETIIHDIKDPRLRNVSINEVKLSSDLGHAKVYCSSLNSSVCSSTELINIISKEGVFLRAAIVRVHCPTCGEEFIGTKRHAGGFIAGHRAFHEFENSQDFMVEQMGGI